LNLHLLRSHSQDTTERYCRGQSCCSSCVYRAERLTRLSCKLINFEYLALDFCQCHHCCANVLWQPRPHSNNYCQVIVATWSRFCNTGATRRRLLSVFRLSVQIPALFHVLYESLELSKQRTQRVYDPRRFDPSRAHQLNSYFRRYSSHPDQTGGRTNPDQFSRIRNNSSGRIGLRMNSSISSMFDMNSISSLAVIKTTRMRG
jgi:hypothetical protein